MDDLLAFQTDKTTQAGFPDVITTHIHAMIATVEQLAALSLPTDGAHERVFRQSSLPGRQAGYFEPSREYYNIFNHLFKSIFKGKILVGVEILVQLLKTLGATCPFQTGFF